MSDFEFSCISILVLYKFQIFLAPKIKLRQKFILITKINKEKLNSKRLENDQENHFASLKNEDILLIIL